MSAYLLAFPIFAAFDKTTGAPLAGGKLWTYQAGTSVPLATYTDSTGATPNANPVILNAAGQASVWLSNANYKMVLQDASGGEQWTKDVVVGIGVTGGAVAASEWQAFTNTVTYISGTSFSTMGDQTLTLHVGRRVKATVAAGTVYATIITSVFSAGTTTVTLLNDSGVLDSGLSAIAYGLLSFVNPSYLSPISAVRVALAANQTPPTNNTTTVNLVKTGVSVLEFDVLGEWNDATHDFTAKYDGYYDVSMHLETTAAVAGWIPVIGSSLGVIGYGVLSNDQGRGNAHAMVYLTAGQKLTPSVSVGLNAITLMSGNPSFNFATIKRMR